MRNEEAPTQPTLMRMLCGAHDRPPKHQQITVGELSVTFQNGALGTVELAGREILHGVYGAVRDQAWGTVEPSVSEIAISVATDGAVIEFLAEHVAAEIDFMWRGTVRLESPATLTFDMDGIARAPCLVGRVGLCALYPVSLGGTALHAETTGGAVESRFPEHVEPNRWLSDLVGMAWRAAPGLEARMTLSGDVFEIEDQRNWTDASYKMFSRPLRLPVPYRLAPGERVHQVVMLELTGRPPPRREPVVRPTVALGTTGRPMPALGTAWTRDGSSLTEVEVAIVREAGPQHLRIAVDLAAADWAERLSRGRADATAVGARVELEVVDGAHDGWRRLAIELGEVRSDLARILVFGRQSDDTPREVLAAARQSLSAADGPPIGGGSRQNFVELNRTPLPLELLEVVAFPICPQVHATDDLSILETVAVQGTIARQARAMSHGRPVVVGPITIGPPGRGIESSAYRTITSDPRQMSLFAAAWLVGSIGALAGAGVAAATYFDVVGQSGFMDRSDPRHPHWLRPSAIFPAFHVFRAFAGRDEYLDVAVASASLLACAARDVDRLTLVVANASPEAQGTEVAMPGFSDVMLAVADETTYEAMSRDPSWAERAGHPIALRRGRFWLELPRYGIAFLTASSELPHG